MRLFEVPQRPPGARGCRPGGSEPLSLHSTRAGVLVFAVYIRVLSQRSFEERLLLRSPGRRSRTRAAPPPRHRKPSPAAAAPRAAARSAPSERVPGQPRGQAWPLPCPRLRPRSSPRPRSASGAPTFALRAVRGSALAGAAVCRSGFPGEAAPHLLVSFFPGACMESASIHSLPHLFI